MSNLLFQGIEMVFNRYFILVIQSEVDNEIKMILLPLFLIILKLQLITEWRWLPGQYSSILEWTQWWLLRNWMEKLVIQSIEGMINIFWVNRKKVLIKILKSSTWSLLRLKICLWNCSLYTLTLTWQPSVTRCAHVLSTPSLWLF